MKMNKKLLFLMLLLISISAGLVYCGGDDDSDGIPADYFFWESLGSPGAGWGTPSAIVIDPSDNKPVVVFRDMTDGRPHVMKWSDGTSWTDMGFLTSYMGDHPSLTIDPSDNKPFVVFVDNAHDGRTAMKNWSSGTTWIDMGFASDGDSRGWWRQPSIAIDPSDNKPVVAFADGVNSWRIHVKKWSGGTSWTDLDFVGSGVGYYPSIAIDGSDNNPIVAFVDVANGERARVMKWSGSSWTDLGFLSTGVTSSTVMAVDPSDNKPVVAFVNTPDTPALQVKKWSSGTTWTDLGYPSQRWSDSPSIAIDPSDNKPVIAFRDWANGDFLEIGNGVHVKKWAGGTSWTGLGYPSEGNSAGPAIAIDPSFNRPVVMYSDSAHTDGNVYVAKHPVTVSSDDLLGIWRRTDDGHTEEGKEYLADGTGYLGNFSSGPFERASSFTWILQNNISTENRESGSTNNEEITSLVSGTMIQLRQEDATERNWTKQ